MLFETQLWVSVSTMRWLRDSSTVESNFSGYHYGAIWGSGTCTSSIFSGNTECDYGTCSGVEYLTACATGTVSF